MIKYHTRIAPSPTGDMHLGTARTAYFNWLAARASGGCFMLRIDDTDPSRSKPEYIEVIFNVMQWLGLDDDRCIHQSNRIGRYLEVANNLVATGKAFERDGAIYLAKIDVPDYWIDEISGRIPITADDLEHLDFQRSSGIVLMGSSMREGQWIIDRATYHFASCVDDWDYNINYIIRGHDHITNTSRQIAIWNALGAPIPKFAHVGLIHFQGKKLSKRDGAASMLHYRDEGYDAEAMLNFMARLGWGPTIDDKTTKLLPRERMLELFLTGGKMKASPANMDLAKLDSFDRKYKAIRRKDVHDGRA